MHYGLIYFTLILNALETLQQIQPFAKIDNESRIIDCAKTIAERYFHQRQNVEIITQNHLYEAFPVFTDFGTVIRSNTELHYTDLRASITKYALIFLDGINYEEESTFLSVLADFHPQGRFVVSITRERDPSTLRKYVERMIFYLASLERWNVVILTHEESFGKIRMFTYNMQFLKNCNRRPQIVDNGIFNDADSLSSLFPMYVNFQKCPIELCTFHIPPYSIVYEKDGKKLGRGIETNVVNLIVERLNASFSLTEVFDGTTLRNNIKTRTKDMAWGYMMQNAIAGTTWTQSYVFIQSAIVIPKSKLKPLWMNLILPFQIEVWVAIITLISFHVAIKYLVPSVRRQFPIEWMVLGFSGIGIARPPTKLSQRLYLLSWIILGYMIMQGYSASLTGFFASPGQYKPIQTLRELDKSNIVIGGLETMKQLFADMYPRIYSSWKVMSEAEYFDNIVNLRTRTASIGTLAPLDQVLNITKDHEWNFNVIPQLVGFFPLAILLPNSSLILEGCNRIIVSVFDAGLIESWKRNHMREMNSGLKSPEDENNMKASLSHLGIVFIMLCIGNGVSSIAFTLELFFAKSRKHS